MASSLCPLSHQCVVPVAFGKFGKLNVPVRVTRYCHNVVVWYGKPRMVVYQKMNKPDTTPRYSSFAGSLGCSRAAKTRIYR